MREDFEHLLRLGAAAFDDGEVVGMAQFDDGEIVGPDAGTHVLGAIEISETPTSTSIEDVYEGDGGTSPLQTDYELDREQRTEALVGPDGEPVDDMTALVQREGIVNTAAAKTAMYVNQNPASALRAILGGQATIQPNGVEQQVVRWAGDNIEARSVTVMVAPVSDASTTLPAGKTKGGRPFARIQFGTRNGIAQFDVDVGEGSQFTIPANVVYAAVGQDAGADIPFTISASIGFFATTRTSPVTRTYYIDNVAVPPVPPSNGVLIRRPKFATSVSFEVDDYSGGATLQFQNANQTTIYQRVLPPSTYLQSPVLLANDVVWVLVTVPTSMSGTINARVIFGLAL